MRRNIAERVGKFDSGTISIARKKHSQNAVPGVWKAEVVWTGLFTGGHTPADVEGVPVSVGSLTNVRLISRFAHAGRLRRVAAKACGLLFALALVFAGGEIYLRVTPPDDLAEYLGSESPRTGPFKPDPRYGAQYRSLDALDADNPGKLAPYRYLFHHRKPPRVWAFFGNSFAQAPGMLADTTRQHVRTRTTFNLGKNEHFPLRFAQAEVLLDEGLPLERIFVVVLPIDGFFFALWGLDQIRVTAGGGVAFEPRSPAACAGLVRNSRLSLQGWMQTGLHLNEPLYGMRHLTTRYDGKMLADFRTVFAKFAEARDRHRVPVTVLLLPNYEQAAKGAGFAFQDAVTPVLRDLRYEVCDVRQVFLDYPDKPALFIPDKHFSDIGNRLLLAAVLEHLKATDPSATDLPEPEMVKP